MCFEACKAAFVSTCRPSIGIDTCFLKGVYSVQLSTAVGKHGNNRMLLIAFAAVEAETRESWSWFVNLLMDDLGGFQKLNGHLFQINRRG